jgi:hypothetical protein
MENVLHARAPTVTPEGSKDRNQVGNEERPVAGVSVVKEV